MRERESGIGIPELESLMSELTLFHQSSDVTPAGFTPRSGDLVSAKFSQDGQWYRAKVRKSNPGKKEAEVIYIDCTYTFSINLLLSQDADEFTCVQMETLKRFRIRSFDLSLLNSNPSKVKPRKLLCHSSISSIGVPNTVLTQWTDSVNSAK